MEIFSAIAIGTAAVAIYLAAVIFAMVHIYRQADLNESEKVVWIVAVFLAPVISAIVWFAAGPHPFGFRLTRDLRK